MGYKLADKLKELRFKNHQMTQQQLADRLGVSKACISSYEIGTAAPSLDTIRKLCSIFSITADELLDLNKRRMVSVDGLKDDEILLVEELISLLKRKRN